MIYLVMGVSGVGKSTIGLKLAAILEVLFLDADQFHSHDSIVKMEIGIPLDDSDREPWLLSINNALITAEKANQDVVLACSALKQPYREILFKGIKDYIIFYLHADINFLKKRLSARKNHFFNPALLESQIKILEIPKGRCISLDANNVVESIINDIINSILLMHSKCTNQPSY